MKSIQLLTLNPKKGFTLIEMLIYMGLLGVFLVVLTDILVQTLDTRVVSTASTYVASDGNFIRDRLSYDVRRASAITAPSSRGVSSSSLQLTISGSTFAYSTTGGNLLLTVNGVSSQLNTSDVQVASFSAMRVGNGTGKDTVIVTYGLESLATKNGSAIETKTYTTTIGTR